MLCRKAIEAFPPGERFFILDSFFDPPKNPNFDSLSHKILGTEMQFSVLGLKKKSMNKEILKHYSLFNFQWTYSNNGSE